MKIPAKRLKEREKEEKEFITREKTRHIASLISYTHAPFGLRGKYTNKRLKNKKKERKWEFVNERGDAITLLLFLTHTIPLRTDMEDTSEAIRSRGGKNEVKSAQRERVIHRPYLQKEDDSISSLETLSCSLEGCASCCPFFLSPFLFLPFFFPSCLPSFTFFFLFLGLILSFSSSLPFIPSFFPPPCLSSSIFFFFFLGLILSFSLL